METSLKNTIKIYENRKREKAQWNIQYQVLAEYFLTRKADFTVNFTPGQFLNRDLYDSTGPKCAKVMAGALLGMLWPEGAQNFALRPSKHIPSNPETKAYYDEISYRQHCAMKDPQAGLALSLGEFMNDDVVFGTAGVAAFEGNAETHLLFQAWDVKRMVVEEGPNRQVNYAAYETEETVFQVCLDFGSDAVSEKTRKAFNEKQLDDKVTVLHIIQPRYDRDPQGLGSFNMPMQSLHIERGGEDKLLRESGYPEMPVFVNRMYKNIKERYGRSPAMDALPDVLELNALREAEIVATEKMLDPPLGVLDDGKLGAGTVDTSAGAINVFNITGRIGSSQPPIFPLYTVGSLNDLKDRIEELKQSVSDHFMIDRLLDLNNETEMTLGEAQIRNKLRAMVLGALFSRLINEVFSPMITRCHNILLKKGILGVMPGSVEYQESLMFGYKTLVIPPVVAQAMITGEDVYEIEYLTPAMRMMQSEVADGIINTWKFMNDLAQTQPEVYDNVDEDKSVETIAPLFGAPREILRDKESIAQIRADRAKAQAQAAQQQMALETMKAMKGLAPQQPAAGVQTPQLSAPLLG